jgi:predicted SpoU family rRNA methylase
MASYKSLAFEYLLSKKCAKLRDIVDYIVDKTGKKYSINLHNDVSDAVRALVKEGVVVRIMRGYYCIQAVAEELKR